MQRQTLQNIGSHDQATQEGNEDYSHQAFEPEESSPTAERERV